MIFMVVKACRQISFHDYREEEGIGVTMQWSCDLDNGEKGWAMATINSEECIFALLETMPRQRGIGTAVMPFIEAEMRREGCKSILALPKKGESRKILSRAGYIPLKENPSVFSNDEYQFYWRKELK